MMARLADTLEELELLKRSLNRRIDAKLKETRALEEQLAAVDQKVQTIKEKSR